MTNENTLPIPLFTVYYIDLPNSEYMHQGAWIENGTFQYTEMVININDAKQMHFIVNRKCILAYTI